MSNSVPGKLKQFTADLHSGKLHQDFHNPPPDAAAQGHHHGEPPKQLESTQVNTIRFAFYLYKFWIQYSMSCFFYLVFLSSASFDKMAFKVICYKLILIMNFYQ